jgi:hypothetical protein
MYIIGSFIWQTFINTYSAWAHKKVALYASEPMTCLQQPDVCLPREPQRSLFSRKSSLTPVLSLDLISDFSYLQNPSRTSSWLHSLCSPPQYPHLCLALPQTLALIQ